MAQVARSQDPENPEIVLSLLESVERDGAQSQRKLAADLGIALGLVNVYLKRCVTKGLVKMSEAPARRYAYYLTPKGFAEKSRLTVSYLSHSFSFFRRARADCSQAMLTARSRGWQHIALLGVSDLAEIAMICALENDLKITTVMDRGSKLSRFVGLPVVSTFEEIGTVDAVIVTDLKAAHEVAALAVESFGEHRVLVPGLLGVRLEKSGAASS